MKRISIVLGVAALMAVMVALAAGTAFAQAETETFHNRGTFTFTVENPCTGEEVLFEGKFNNTVHVTLNKNGYHDVTRSQVSDVTGTGLQTGDKYRFINAGGLAEYSEIEEEVGGLYVGNDETMFMVVSEGSSPNFLMHLLYKVTFDTADGQPGLVFEAQTIGCTPEVETTRPPIE
jgi:hypothetical protein